MFGVFRNCFGIASHRLPGLHPNDEGDRERLVCHLANRDAHDPSPWFACERGLYVRPPVKGVLPNMSSSPPSPTFISNVWPTLLRLLVGLGIPATAVYA